MPQSTNKIRHLNLVPSQKYFSRNLAPFMVGGVITKKGKKKKEHR